MFPGMMPQIDPEEQKREARKAIEERDPSGKHLPKLASLFVDASAKKFAPGAQVKLNPLLEKCPLQRMPMKDQKIIVLECGEHITEQAKIDFKDVEQDGALFIRMIDMTGVYYDDEAHPRVGYLASRFFVEAD